MLAHSQIVLAAQQNCNYVELRRRIFTSLSADINFLPFSIRLKLFVSEPINSINCSCVIFFAL